MAREDIEGSIAHAAMLGACGVIDKDEAGKICIGLEQILPGPGVRRSADRSLRRGYPHLYRGGADPAGWATRASAYAIRPAAATTRWRWMSAFICESNATR